jgi:hypothetical protein
LRYAKASDHLACAIVKVAFVATKLPDSCQVFLQGRLARPERDPNDSRDEEPVQPSQGQAKTSRRCGDRAESPAVPGGSEPPF